MATSYHLSRSSSDPIPIWNILKTHLWPGEEELQEAQMRKKETRVKYPRDKRHKKPDTKSNSHTVNIPSTDKKESAEENSEELVDPLPSKLQRTVNCRLKSDLIICTVTAVFVFGIHCSTVFSALQPELNPVSLQVVLFIEKSHIVGIGSSLYHVPKETHSSLFIFRSSYGVILLGSPPHSKNNNRKNLSKKNHALPVFFFKCYC